MKADFRQARQIKFAETLRALLERDSRKAPRKDICSRLGVSQAVLSQYLHGKSIPRLQKLVAIAEFFGVALDYLVFGELGQSTRTIDLGPFQYIDKSLAGLHAKSDAYFAAVARITSALAQEVETAARRVVDEYDISGGVIHDNEIFTIEQYSDETTLVRLRLDYQFDSKTGEPYQTMPGGRFLPLVAKNIAEGRKYTYILPKGIRDWRQPVKEFRTVLQTLGVSDQALRDSCKIGLTNAPLVAGCILYRLDVTRLMAECPHLQHHVRLSVERVRHEAWLGCTLPPSTKLQANPVMDSYHLEQTKKMVSRILRESFEEL